MTTSRPFADGDRLEFTDPDGDARDWKVLSCRTEPPSADGVYEVDTIEIDPSAPGPSRLTRKTVRQSGAARDPLGYGRLENEIRIGLRLLRRFGDLSYPPEFTRIVGYDIDAEDPFVLFAVYEGTPLAQVAGRLSLDEQHDLQIGLLRAVRIMEQLGLVHRDITPFTTRWNGASVQLGDFRLAVPAGTPRSSVGSAPWACPEQRRGVGTTDTRDDVWSAGRVLYHVTTAHPPELLDRQTDLADAGPALRQVLADVFAAREESRPRPGRLLERLRVHDPWPPPPDEPDPQFVAGWDRFNTLMRQKWGSSYRPVAPDVLRPRQAPPEEPSTERAAAAEAARPSASPAPASAEPTGVPGWVYAVLLLVIAGAAVFLIVNGG